MAHQSNLVTRISTQSITVILDGSVRTIQASAPNFPKLSDALKAGKESTKGYDLDLIRDLVDISSFVARETHGLVEVSDNQVRYKGQKVEGLIVTRILQHLDAGYSVKPLALFLEKLMLNPIPGVREDLFAWLESGDMPIADDGDIVAFKKVQDDYYSYHSGKRGKVLHAMGTVVEIPREEVDANRAAECSTGLHFCSYGYLSAYQGSAGRVLMVKINPADVVAIPMGYNRQKGRTFRMFVYDEVKQTEAQAAYSGRLIAPKTGLIEQEKTARISTEDDNNLGEDGNGQVISIGQLRGLLAHGGLPYTAEKLNITIERVDALAEMIDFKKENLGDLSKPKAVEAKAPDVTNNPQVAAFIAKFGGSLAHANKAKEASDAGKSAHDALFKDPELNVIVRNVSNVASFDAAVNDIFGNTKPLKVKVSAKKPGKAKTKKAKEVVKAAKKAAAPLKTVAPKGLTFSRDGVDYTSQQVVDGVKALGQRGYAASTGIPRTTLQTWIAQIKQA
jgi:hypothetical protein